MTSWNGRVKLTIVKRLRGSFNNTEHRTNEAVENRPSLGNTEPDDARLTGQAGDVIDTSSQKNDAAAASWRHAAPPGGAVDVHYPTTGKQQMSMKTRLNRAKAAEQFRVDSCFLR